MPRRKLGWVLVVVAVAAACRDGREEAGNLTAVSGDGEELASAGEIEAVEPPGARFEEISPFAVLLPPRLPLSDEAGPAVLRIQVMLDRARFSPGVLDGFWGRNTVLAMRWFQHAAGLEPTGRLDAATYEHLIAGSAEAPPVTLYVVTNADLAGPFVELPEDVYAKADADCLCYESVIEYLAERFHTTPAVLERLNPGMDFDRLEAGSLIWVPNVEIVHPDLPAEPKVARINVSRNEFYTHALDADGNILFHFPSTLGAGYDPSPEGELDVVATTFEPWFHYQPELLPYADDDDDDALLPPGPNSPVGLVWMALSRPHYGIHGTDAPETIGYASSAGCVRLTNWDAIRLANHVEPRTPVVFR